MQKFTKSILILFCVIAGVDAIAQTDTATFKNLDEIVVTAQYKPQSLRKSVYQIRVIDKEKIVMSGASNIQQVLSTQLGFRFSNDNALGISDVKLNGIGGNNVKILLDGIPLVDRYDQRVSLSQIDVNTIDHIEIVEGPMSVSFGSDATAGVINIITKKIKKDAFGVNASIKEETAGGEYYPFSYKGVHLQNLGVNFSRKHFISSIGISHNDFDGFGGDEFGRGKSWKPKDQWMANGKIGYADDRFHVYYRLDALRENILIRNPINLNNYKAVDQKFISHRLLHQLQGGLDFSSRFQMNGFLAYTNYQRETNTIRRDFEANTIEPDLAGEEDVSKLSGISFKTTFQYRLSEKVSFQPGIDFNHEKAAGARIEGAPQINDYAFFLSSEIKPTAFVSLRPGVRFSHNSQYHAAPVIPSLNTKLTLSSRFDLRLAYGHGFRAPTLRELYLTFYDANHNLVGNKDLKAEVSNSINGSLSFSPASLSSPGLRSTLSAFYTSYQNQIDLLQSVSNNLEYTYYNTDESTVVGAGIENTFHSKKVLLGAGVSVNGYSSTQYDDENYIKEDSRSFLWTPEINANITYEMDKVKTKLGLFYKFTGSKPAFSYGMIDNKDAILLTRTASYHLADFTATTEVNKFFTAQAGIKNIFDVTDVRNNTGASSNETHSNAAPLPVAYGRSFFIGLSFRWNKK